MTTSTATLWPAAGGSNPSLASTLDELAWAIEADGIERHEPAVARVVAALRTAGADLTWVDVVADRSAPAVARERAFGRLTLVPSGRGAPVADPGLAAA
jgi:hypothetical protein